jgi:hypothetical protein
MLAFGMLTLGAPDLRSQTKTGAKGNSVSNAAVSSDLSQGPGKDASKIAAIKSFRIVQEVDGPALEVLSTKPLVPSIHAMTNPDRLVVDLPNAHFDTQENRISVQADEIAMLRADQLQQSPPIARLVVDLLAPRAFTWDAAGNRLVVHLGKNPTQADGSPFQPASELATVPSPTPAPQPVVAAVRAAGPLALAANDSGSGSVIAAAAETTIVSLSSGGEVHVCPGTTVALTPSQDRHRLMLSMNTGALETHFALDATSDSVITPDFRILLAGPGEFHYAISADSQGNTCVRSLPGNTASAMVTELLGDRTYQVKATDQLVFHGGQLDRVDMVVPLECGCPPPRDAPLRAMNSLPTENESAASLVASSANVAEMAHAERGPSTGVPAGTQATPQDPSAASNELHVQIEAPFVFHPTGPPPAPVEDVRALPLDSRPRAGAASDAPPPPVAVETPRPAATETASAKHEPVRRFFRKVGGFLAALFR